MNLTVIKREMASKCCQGEIVWCLTLLVQSLWHDCDKTSPELRKEHLEMWLNIVVGSKSDDWIMGHNGKGCPKCNSILSTVQRNNASCGTHCELERCNHWQSISTQSIKLGLIYRPRRKFSETWVGSLLSLVVLTEKCPPVHVLHPRRPSLLKMTLVTRWQHKYYRHFPFSQQSKTSLVNCNEIFIPNGHLSS